MSKEKDPSKLKGSLEAMTSSNVEATHVKLIGMIQPHLTNGVDDYFVWIMAMMRQSAAMAQGICEGVHNSGEVRKTKAQIRQWFFEQMIDQLDLSYEEIGKIFDKAAEMNNPIPKRKKNHDHN